jgi:hypothetical protein
MTLDSVCQDLKGRVEPMVLGHRLRDEICICWPSRSSFRLGRKRREPSRGGSLGIESNRIESNHLGRHFFHDHHQSPGYD